MPGEAPRDAAGCRHDVGIDVAVVFTRECDQRSVRRKMRVCFASRTTCQPSGLATHAWHRPQITTEDENDIGLRECRLLHQKVVWGIGSLKNSRNQQKKRDGKSGHCKPPGPS